MFWPADQDKQLSNQSATLESPDVRPVFMRFHDSWWSSEIWMEQSSHIYSHYYSLGLTACRNMVWTSFRQEEVAMSACIKSLFFFWSRSGLRFVTDQVVCSRWIKGNYAKGNLFTFISGLDKLRAKREPWIWYSLARNELWIALEFRFSGRAIVQILGHICRHLKWFNTGKTEY